MNNTKTLELIRVRIEQNQIFESGKASKFFDVHNNSQNLTEEFLYAHQPVTDITIPIYATSEKMIGKIDYDVAKKQKFNIIEGPAIIVARKGYAGRLFVIKNDKFIVHEDAYPIKPKDQYLGKINLDWFAHHYSEEFQANRTSAWGIGDFPRTRFNNMRIVVPKLDLQNTIADLYLRRKIQIEQIKEFEKNLFSQMHNSIAEIVD